MTRPAADLDAAARIIANVRAGSPVRRAIREEGISCSAFYTLIEMDRDVRERYARAKHAGVDAVVDEAMEIADDPKLDPNDKRVRIDIRKFYAAKLAPKVYGDKLELDAKVSVSDAIVDRLLRARSEAGPGKEPAE